jgi:hypothetical protein
MLTQIFEINLFAIIRTNKNMAMIAIHIASLGIVSITIILAASILSVALTEFGRFLSF